MTTAPLVALGRPAIGQRARWRYWRGELRGSEYAWAIAFLVPYIVVFLAFVAYPVTYGLWLGSKPSLYVELWDDPIYRMTLVNTVLYVGIGVNLRTFMALLLSGFFIRPGWWTKALLMIFVLPWAVPMLPTYISIHWMMDGENGLLNNMLWTFFHIEGPSWLNDRWLALGTALVSFNWKWIPFWTVILLAGRMAIPQDVHDAAKVDGCTGLRHFWYITCPMIGNLYLVCTLLGTMFTLGDFNTIYFITGGGPAMSTYVLANLGIRDAFDLANPRLGVAAVMSALPVMVPLVILLMRKLKTAEVQL
jgi:multiple sugar transport system permease protein